MAGDKGVKSIAADMLFRVFTACPGDPRTLIVDVRPLKEYSKNHILQSYCVRLSANGKALLVSCVSKLNYHALDNRNLEAPKYCAMRGPAFGANLRLIKAFFRVQDYSKNSYDFKWSEHCW